MGKKGQLFENLINKELSKLSKKEFCYFIKSPTPIRMIATKEGYKMAYAEKALCDFIGIFQGKFILIEAKEISGIRFDFKRLKDHQIKQLSSIQKHGGYSIILFNVKQLNKIISVSIDKYLIYLNQTEKKSININALFELGREINSNSLDILLMELIQ